MHSFHMDHTHKAVRGIASGLWSGPEAALYIADLQVMVHDARVRYGRVRVLVDAREASVHSPDAVRHLMRYRAIFTETDRVAIVVSSSLKKQQVAPTMPACGKTFMSMNAAETWLFAYDHMETPAARQTTA